jgi:hypothetical protein
MPLEHFADPGLPAGSAGLEVIQNVAGQPQRHLPLGRIPTGGLPRLVSVPVASRTTTPPTEICARSNISSVHSIGSSSSLKASFVSLSFPVIPELCSYETVFATEGLCKTALKLHVPARRQALAKNGKSGQPASTKTASGKATTYRSAVSGRFVGRTKDGISITGPKSRSRHFTRKQAREAVDSIRDA